MEDKVTNERVEIIYKIIEYIKNDRKNGGMGIVSNELIDNIAGRTVDSNSKTIIRKSIPFATEDCIVPVQLDDGGARRTQHTTFQFLPREEYDKFRFSKRNFRFLNTPEINNIIRKATGDLGKTMDTKTKLKLLTMCDTIKNLTRRGFKEINIRILASSIMESKDTVQLFLKMLIKVGVLENNYDMYRFIFLDPTEMRHPTRPKKSKIVSVNVEDSDEFIKSIVEVYNTRSARIAELEKEVEELKEANEQVAKEVVDDLEKKLTEANQAIEIVKEQSLRLKRELDQEKENNKKYANDLKDYKQFRKDLEGRVQTVMDNFMMNIKRATDDFSVQNNVPRLMTNINLACADTIRSVMNVTSMKK